MEIVAGAPLGDEELARLLAHWRAANYLSVGQIYLMANPLLRQPLSPLHIKPRLLGHWGTSPGLNLVYTHLCRIIARDNRPVLYIAGPGHGGPALVANTWLEGGYSELYPNIAQDLAGLRQLFKQFSFPGGVGSHATPETPGSIHEGGELGYALSHAFGAAFDNPDLIVSCVVGDGEAETGPMAAAWHSNKFLNPIRDGAVRSRWDLECTVRASRGHSDERREVSAEHRYMTARAHATARDTELDAQDHDDERGGVNRTTPLRGHGVAHAGTSDAGSRS